MAKYHYPFAKNTYLWGFL